MHMLGHEHAYVCVLCMGMLPNKINVKTLPNKITVYRVLYSTRVRDKINVKVDHRYNL